MARFGWCSWTAVVLVIFGSIPVRGAWAQEDGTAAPPAVSWRAEMRDVAIPMRDGKSLAADVYLPPRAGRYPAVLIQTPYDKKRLGAPIAETTPTPGVAARGALSDYRGLLDREHYAYVIVDWRGFYASRPAKVAARPGKWRRGMDGYDCVEWVAAQSWCDGKVGTWGGSALGRVQFDTAMEQPPHLVCSVPLIAPLGQEYEQYYEGGIPLEAHVKGLDFLGFEASGRVRSSARPDDPLWTLARRLTYHPERIEVPCLFITGWWDNFPDLILKAFEDLVAQGGPAARTHSRMLVGPWDHVSIGVSDQGERKFPGAELESARMAQQFFDRFLRGVENGWEEVPRLRYWSIDEEGWREAESWSGIQRGVLTPAVSGSRWEYRNDPKKPTPTLGGANLPPLKHGPWDQGALEQREDVLTWATGPFETPVRVAGNVELSFEFKADRATCDFLVRLCSVDADGKPMLLADVGRRVRGIEPGVTGRVRLRFPALAFAARELRLYVASTHWPRYERNPHTGADFWDEAAALPLSVVIEPDSVELRLPTAP